MGHEFTLDSPFSTQPAPQDGELLPDFILRKAREHVQAGKTVWIRDAATGETQEFSQFEEQTRRVACNMYKKGLRKGDTIIYMTSHFVKLPSFFVGVWRANGIVRSTYPEDDADALAMRVEESRAGWILCDENVAELCLGVAKKMYWDVEVIVVGNHEHCTPFDFLFEDIDAELPAMDICEDDPALILCTSGTTGLSKGAVYTHRAIAYAINSTLLVPFPSEIPSLLVTKCTHISGFIFPFTFVCAGKYALVMSVVTKTGIYQAIHHYKPSFIWGFPTFLLALVLDPEAAKYDFSSLEIAATGGMQITPAMVKAMSDLKNLKAVLNFYGMTEVMPITAELNYDTLDEEHVKLDHVPPFSIGKVCPGVKVQIRDPDTGSVLGQHQKGEICCKSPATFSYYMNDTEATNDAFIDGWFRTGDLGYYDENHFVFLVDRIKDVFKYWNNHISPTELEKVIGQHPAVKEVCVIGVDDPDGGGFIPRAFVTLTDPACSLEDIVLFSKDRLPTYKHLRGGLFAVNDLPKGKTGKIQRSLVSKMTLDELGVIMEENINYGEAGDDGDRGNDDDAADGKEKPTPPEAEAEEEAGKQCKCEEQGKNGNGATLKGKSTSEDIIENLDNNAF